MSLRRMYETTIIVNVALEDADIDALINKVIGIVGNHGGKIIETNKWGSLPLAYEINKKKRGYYVHLVFDTAPSTIPVLERFLVLEDAVLRHLTLVLPKKLYDYRAKRALEEGVAYSAMKTKVEKVKEEALAKTKEAEETEKAKEATKAEEATESKENAPAEDKAETAEHIN